MQNRPCQLYAESTVPTECKIERANCMQTKQKEVIGRKVTPGIRMVIITHSKLAVQMCTVPRKYSDWPNFEMNVSSYFETVRLN